MTRGVTSKIGDTRISPNGYEYTRTEDGWRLTHHLVAEKMLGRPLAADERVKFKTKNRRDLSEKNLEVVLKGRSSLRRQLANLEARRNEIDAQIKSIKAELESGKLR
jgi:septal ring factor EnvC (AmiA/AmiB activator)